MASSKNPYELVLEFSRAREAGDPYAFQFEEQEYQLRLEGGVFQSAPFPWNPRVLADLGELEKPAPERGAVQRLGNHLRAFLGQLEWARHEAAIEQALAEGREVQLCIRSAAAELYALPWELLTLKGSGQHLGEMAGCTLRYEWPRPEAPPRVAAPAEGGRILFAWSTAGGEVGAAEHLRAIEQACEQGDVPFDARRDVLGDVSLRGLAEALETAHEPVSVLHILCHGGRAGAQGYGLVWNASREGGAPEVVDGARLRQVLAPYAATLRLVVLSACRSGAGELGSHLGSVAQELHRVGIGAVVASRLPLSVAGAIRLTQVLYAEMLGVPCSLERALSEARKQLALDGRHLDWASLQLYARVDEGPDLRPVALRPYRGLLAFEAKHRRFFFGRDKLARTLLERVQQAVEGKLPRFQVVAGASGAGKSSVVMAGLVPLLPADEWDVRVVRPGELVAEGGASDGRFASLRGLSRRLRALASTEPLAEGAGFAEAEVLEEARRLRQRRPGRKLLLVVDQLEEVFTQLGSVEERGALMRVLWSLGGQEERACVVLCTIRVDHFERCGEVALDERTRLDTVVYSEAHRVFVAHMEAEELAQAIERPAEVVGLELEAGLVEQVCQEVGQEPGALPLLEYALDLLWQRREGRRLTNLAYERMGGVTGALTQTADQLYAGLSEAQRRQARRLLVRLVDFRDAASPQTRRRVRVEEVWPAEDEARKALEQVLEKLVGSRLLVKGREEGPEGGGTWVQFAHEALIRRWTSLQTWVKEDWEREQQLREVDAWAEAWVAHQGGADQGASYLLTGDRLGYGRSVRDRFPGELSPRSLALIAESEAAEARSQEEERASQERTLAAARALAEARERELASARELATTQRREARRLRIGLAALAGLVLLALGTAAVAVSLRGEAEHQRTSALDASRVIEARHLHGQSPTLAALVLREVVHREQTPEWMQTAVELLQTPLSTAVLADHRDGVVDASFSPDGQWVVTASHDKTARVWRADGKGAPVVLRGHTEALVSAAFSPDGKQVVTASHDKTARVWRVDGMGEPVVLRGHTEALVSAAFSPDGKQMVTASHDKTARVWRVDGTGEPVVLRGHQSLVKSVAFSPDGTQVVTASEDTTARVWRADGTGEPVVLRGHTEALLSAAFSPDGTQVVTASGDKTARVWRADGKGEPVMLRSHQSWVLAAAFSPDGKQVVTASGDKTARVWRVDGTGEPVVLRGHEWDVRFATFSPDGQSVVTASMDKTARVWRADGTGEPRVLRGHVESVVSAAFSLDSQWVVTASMDKTARVWRTHGMGEPVVLHSQHALVRSVDFSPDGRSVVTVSGENTVRVWRAEGTGAPVVLRGHQDWVLSVAFSPDSQWVVTASADKTARVWKADGTGEPVVLRAHDGAVWSAVFSPDGQRVLTASADKTARVWRADGTGEPVVLRGHGGTVSSAAFSPDGKWVVTASVDTTARVWRADWKGEPVVLRGHGGAVSSAAFSPDGKWVVTTSRENSAWVWRADGQGELVVLRGHAGTVSSAAFSLDGKWVVTASQDRTAWVWRADGTGEPVALRGHDALVSSAAFSPDGKWVVTASADKTVRVWKADGQSAPVVLRGHGNEVASAVFSLDGSRVLSVAQDTTARIWTVGSARLQELLLTSTTACLLPEERQRFLLETADQARPAHEQCERAYGRKPLETSSMRGE
ncbi:CHAT domain-containing protein [Archangium gephyra]|nr:CHAT domain-containing protein [Archangium gephyra]